MSDPNKEKFLWRVINLGLGSLYVILAMYVALNPDVAVLSLILILSVVLLFSGILRIFNAFFESDKNGAWRIFYFVFGIVTVFIGLAVVMLQDFGLELLILLLALGLALQGMSRVGTGLRKGPLPIWLQFIFVIFGLTSIVLAIFVMISTEIAILTLTVYLAYGFLLNGFTRLLIAISGNNPYKVN